MKLQFNKILLLVFSVFTMMLNAQSQFATYTKNDGLTSSSIIFTYVDSKNIIWAATKDGLNAFTGKEWIPIKSIVGSDGDEQDLGKVIKIFEASNADLWVATEKGIFVYNRENWICYTEKEKMTFLVKFLFEDRMGNIWVLSEMQGRMKDVSTLGFFIVEAEIQMFNGWQWFDFTNAIGGSAAIKLGNQSEYFTSIIQSKDGDIWISTMDGLYQYDFEKWVTYNREELPSDRCYQVLESNESDIWVVTSKGVTKKSGNDWIKFDQVKGLANYIPYEIIEDSENRVWILSLQGEKVKSLAYFMNGKWKIFYAKEIHQKGKLTLFKEFDGKMLTYSDQGLSIYSNEKWRDLTKLFGIKDSNFSQAIYFGNKSAFFASGNGLYQLKNDSLSTLLSVGEAWSVTSIFKDSGGDIWVGTHKGGLYHIEDQNNKRYTKDNGLADDSVEFIFEDKKNNVWIVTEDGISRFIKH